MGRKVITQDFISDCREIHGDMYDYSLVKYDDMRTHVVIICHLHGEFYQQPRAHKSGQGCPKCAPKKISKSRNRIDFEKRAREVHGDFYDYSLVEFISTRKRVKIICPIHGLFLQQPRSHIYNNADCPKCAKEKFKISKSIKKNEFLEKAFEIHGDFYDYSEMEYKNISNKIKIKCKKHGFFFQKAYAHVNEQKQGCPKCARELNRNTTDDFIKNSISLFGKDSFSYEKSVYIKVDEPIIVTCKNHGDQIMNPTDHYRIGCWKCKRNRRQDLWLDEKGIPNDKCHRQVRLFINDKLHIVDGFDEMSNTVFLFHGDYWHGNPEVYEINKINSRNGLSFGELYKKTIEYENRIKVAGYNLEVIWEKTWIEKNA